MLPRRPASEHLPSQRGTRKRDWEAPAKHRFSLSERAADHGTRPDQRFGCRTVRAKTQLCLLFVPPKRWEEFKAKVILLNEWLA